MNSGNFQIGARAFDAGFPGSIDEARVSNTVRSAAWITTEYKNQSSPSTFASIGGQQWNDTTAPTSSLSFTSGTNPGGQYAASTGAHAWTYYYNAGATTTFTMTDTASDAGSGIQSAEFPNLTTTGFTGTGLADTTSPYTSNTYTITTANTTAPSAQPVNVFDGAGNSTVETVTFVRDTTAPTGQTVALSGGPYYTTLSVPLTLANGSDTGSGINTATGVVQRASATLSAGSCGSFGAYAPVTLTGGADTTVVSGNCYRYQYLISDNVGNQSAASVASADAKVDTSAPSAPTLTYSAMTNVAAIGNALRYLPGSAGGFSVAASSADDQSGIAGYGFPTLPAGWTISGSGASRSWTYTVNPTAPSGNQNVSATNNAGLSASTPFTLVPDTRPSAVNDSYGVNEDGSLAPSAATGVLANDTDAEVDPLTAVLVTNVTHGTLTLNADGSFTYTPAANYNGPDSFTYKANDGWFDSASNATVTITITAVNDAPVAVADAYSMFQDNTLVVAAGGVLANDTDVDLQALTVGTPRPISGPNNGSLTLNADGSFSYTPAAGFTGSDSFTYKATDGIADSAPATVTITVNSTAYVSAAAWTTSFDAARYLGFSFPAYLPAGATVDGATFRHSYRSYTTGTTCYYIEVYEGATLIGAHGSAGAPISCNSGTSYVTDTVALPEINTVARANSAKIRLYVRNSATGRSEHSLATLGVTYWLGNP